MPFRHTQVSHWHFLANCLFHIVVTPGVRGRKNSRGQNTYHRRALSDTTYVKWIGYTPHHNTWEDEADLTHTQDILGDFLSIVPDPPPPLTQCQAKLCTGAAVSARSRCSATPRSTRCAKHSCMPCGPATHCPCKPQHKQRRSLSSPTKPPEPPRPNRLTLPTPPNITQPHTFPSQLATIPEHNQLDITMAHASPRPPPHPSNDCTLVAPRAPFNRP